MESHDRKCRSTMPECDPSLTNEMADDIQTRFFKATVSVGFIDTNDARTVFAAVEPENMRLPDGLTCRGHVVAEKTLEYQVATSRGIASLRATIDDLLKSIAVATNVLYSTTDKTGC